MLRDRAPLHSSGKWQRVLFFHLLTPNEATGQKFLAKDLTDSWVHEKYNSRKILAPLKLVYFFQSNRDNSEILEANFTKQ